jgi:ABC-2 type transport system ATP-binding protein/lipopolysaccharide transport system ATP-binding protein
LGNAIEVSGLGKRYTIGGRTGARLLTEVVGNWLRGRRAPKGEDFWALVDVSFTVGSGELVGIIGRNGAGKTTLLRILARITAPSAGVARVRGRLSALLDVGTGFHDELTGRENVFLSGAILGMSRRDVRARFDDIAAFSGVERFLDTPLKRYSAGMRLRLAFAVAAHLEPEVLVIDEALAVGDAEFQQRCIGRMEDLQRSGRTVVFVSHDLGAIGRLCERTLWLDRGQIAFDGPTPETLRRYFEAVGRIDAGRAELESDPHLPVALTSVWLAAEDGSPVSEPARHEAVVLRLRVQVRDRIPGLDVGFYVTDSMGQRVLEDTLRVAEPASPLGGAPGDAELAVTLPAVLRADDYLVGIYVYAGHDYYVVEEPLRFRVAPAQGESDDGIRPAVRPQLSWSVTL